MICRRCLCEMEREVYRGVDVYHCPNCGLMVDPCSLDTVEFHHALPSGRLIPC
jgi:Zn-finger nucleic acid-binding protein